MMYSAEKTSPYTKSIAPRLVLLLLLGLYAQVSQAVEHHYKQSEQAAAQACSDDATRRQALATGTSSYGCTRHNDPKFVESLTCSSLFCTDFATIAEFHFPETPCPDGEQFVDPGVCQPPEQKDKQCGCPGTEQNPCNPATGNKYQPEEDFRSGDGRLALKRNYNSQTNIDVGFGAGWASNIHRRLEITDATHLLVRQGDGRAEPFRNTAAQWQGDADTKLTLTQDGSGYTLTLRDRSIERYDASGKLTSETDRTGNTTTYGYDANGRLATVTSPFGHTLAFSYNPSGRISTVTDPAGRAYTYTYNPSGNLTQVTFPDSSAKRYHYENTQFPHHLTGISFDDGAGTARRFSTYVYEPGTGKVLSTEHAASSGTVTQEKRTYSYDTVRVAITDAAGTIETLTFSPSLGARNLIARLNQSDNKSLIQTFDGNNNLTCRQDEEGGVTTYIYNSANQRLSMTEGQSGTCASPVSTAATRTTTYTYLSPQLDLPTRIETPSVYGTNKKATIVTYDSATQLPTVITQSGFKPDGTAISRTVTLGYNTRGQLTTIDGPRTDVADITTLTYHDCTTGSVCGQLASVTNAIGLVTTFDAYDANGRLLQSTDSNAVKTNYSYDLRGRLTGMTVTPPIGAGNPRTTQYFYNYANQLTKVISPDGVTLTYTYDAAQYLRSVTDNLGNKITYNYDAKGNRVSEQTYDPNGTLVRLLDRTYDARNHLATLNAAGSVTQQLRDALGNLVQETDANNTSSTSPVVTTYSYDKLNRLVKTIDRLSGPTDYAYDAADRLTQVTAPNGLSTGYIYDDLGNLLQEQSQQRGNLLYTYDAAGNVESIADARGTTRNYTYDALNRMTQATGPATSYAYDTCVFGAGRLCQVNDDAGTTQYTYDAFGNVATQTRIELGVNYVTQYTYDAGNRIASITYPDGRLVSYTRNAIGRVTTVTATVGGASTSLLTGLSYRPDGLITSRTYGNGITETRSYNLKGELINQSGGPIGQTYSYDLNGNPTQTFSLSNSYDLLDRLIQANGSSSHSYTYDGNGDLLLASANTTAGPASEAFTYTADGHLASYRKDGSLVASYSYNYQRQRTRKSAGTTTVYHYDTNGNLIQETDGSGTPIRTYIWLNDIPIAQITNPGSVITYLHTDHLATPHWGTNSSGTLVWRWGEEPYGSIPPNEDVDGDTVTTTVNLRYPGQYFDGESGLFYNWNRYYDPRVGRYITSDPIGLAPGVTAIVRTDPAHAEPSSTQRSIANALLRRGVNHPYSYVGNNPLLWGDSLGLMRVKVVQTTMGEQVFSLGSLLTSDCGTMLGGCHGSFQEHLRVTLTAEASDSCVLINFISKVINGPKTRTGALITWWQETYDIYNYGTAEGACKPCQLTDFQEETRSGAGGSPGGSE